MLQFGVHAMELTPDGSGGSIETPIVTYSGFGYLDMMTGTNQNQNQNSQVANSTHILIVPDIPQHYETIFKSQDMIVANGKRYRIEYVDNPVNADHHLEIYLRGDQHDV